MSVDQIVARQLKGDWRELAESQQRIDILSEYFNQTVKFSRAIWNFLLNDMNYSPGELDNPERCNHLVLAHEKLHQAARSLREGTNDLYKELKVYKSNVKYTEGKIRKESEREQERENARKLVGKTAVCKSGGA